MSVLPLIILPDPLLRKKSRPIPTPNQDVKKLAYNMIDTMYEASGIGLAAIQVGLPLELIVVDVNYNEEIEQAKRTPLICINPEILSVSEERNLYNEGCLSIPEYYAEIERPKEITIQYIDLSGKLQKLTADGLLATCLQHEIDHLKGVLFIDYLSKIKKDMVIRKFKKRAREQNLQGKLL